MSEQTMTYDSGWLLAWFGWWCRWTESATGTQTYTVARERSEP